MWPLLAQQETGGFQQTIDSLARTPLSQIVIFVVICSVVRAAAYSYLKNTLPHKRHGVYKLVKFVNEAMDAVIYAGVFVFMLIRPFAVQAFLIPSGSMLQTLYLNDFIVANKAIYRYSEPKVGDIVVFKPPVWALNKGQGDVDFIKRCQGVPGDVVEIKGNRLWRNGQSVDEPYLSNSPGQGPEANGHPTSVGKDAGMSSDWKLIHYTGSARPDLKGQYIPVQIQRDMEPGDPSCNYGAGFAGHYPVGGICRKYAVGVGHPDSSGSTWVNDGEWTPRDLLTKEDWAFENELKAAPPAAVPKGYVLMMGDNRNNSYDGRAWGIVPREDVIGRSEFIWLPISRWRITR
jgi:signal peptidase I